MDLFSYQPPVSTRALAQEGMQRAADHADATEPKWTERAYACFQRYAKAHVEFMTEEVRVWAHDEGLSLPPTGRAWGAVAARAVREGIVSLARYELTKVPPAHATPRPVWRSTVYRA